MIIALEEASEKVDSAVNATVKNMVSKNASVGDSIKALRYPATKEERLVHKMFSST